MNDYHGFFITGAILYVGGAYFAGIVFLITGLLGLLAHVILSTK